MHNFHFSFFFFSITEFFTLLLGNNNKEIPMHRIPIPQMNKKSPVNSEGGILPRKSVFTTRTGLTKNKKLPV